MTSRKRGVPEASTISKALSQRLRSASHYHICTRETYCRTCYHDSDNSLSITSPALLALTFCKGYGWKHHRRTSYYGAAGSVLALYRLLPPNERHELPYSIRYCASFTRAGSHLHYAPLSTGSKEQPRCEQTFTVRNLFRARTLVSRVFASSCLASALSLADMSRHARVRTMAEGHH